MTHKHPFYENRFFFLHLGTFISVTQVTRVRRSHWYCWEESYEVIKDKVSLPWREKSCPVQDFLEFLNLLVAEFCSALEWLLPKHWYRRQPREKCVLPFSRLLKTAIMWSGLPSATHPFLHSSFLSDVHEGGWKLRGQLRQSVGLQYKKES